MNQRVPVFMYHSVGIPNPKWKWSFLTCPYQIFEHHLLWLKKHDFQTINLDDLYEYIFKNKQIPQKSVVLTFDDGYADNYVFAYPLLKKYGFKGTIFINPDFVDPRTNPRTKFDDLIPPEKLEDIGFLSWCEMIEMENEGIMDIQCHSLTHTWYPISTEIIDFRHPHDNYQWMTWNDFPEKKPFLQIDDPNLIKYGSPVFKYDKSLNSPRIVVDKEIENNMVSFVEENGGLTFFENAKWREILKHEILKIGIKTTVEESNEQYYARIKYELKTSKEAIEQKMKKKVNFLCWPGGSGTKIGVSIAQSLGFKMTTAAKDLPVNYRKKIKNSPEMKIRRIARISPVLHSFVKGNELITIFADNFGMKLRIKSFKSNYHIKRLINAIIIVYSLRYKIWKK